jgi:hypothetical protein
VFPVRYGETYGVEFLIKDRTVDNHQNVDSYSYIKIWVVRFGYDFVHCVAVVNSYFCSIVVLANRGGGGHSNFTAGALELPLD